MFDHCSTFWILLLSLFFKMATRYMRKSGTISIPTPSKMKPQVWCFLNHLWYLCCTWSSPVPNEMTRYNELIWSLEMLYSAQQTQQFNGNYQFLYLLRMFSLNIEFWLTGLAFKVISDIISLSLFVLFFLLSLLSFLSLSFFLPTPSCPRYIFIKIPILSLKCEVRTEKHIWI